MNIKKLCILSLISFIFLTGCTTNQQQNSENKQIEQKMHMTGKWCACSAPSVYL